MYSSILATNHISNTKFYTRINFLVLQSSNIATPIFLCISWKNVELGGKHRRNRRYILLKGKKRKKREREKIYFGFFEGEDISYRKRKGVQLKRRNWWTRKREKCLLSWKVVSSTIIGPQPTLAIMHKLSSKHWVYPMLFMAP